MDQELIRLKFGNKYIADDMTFKMGIDIRFTDYLASRFKNMIVLETCTGGGFSTISLAKYAKHVYSFEINGGRIQDAIKNAEMANIREKVTFINDDILNAEKYDFMNIINSAYIDPDWAVTGPDHIYKFNNSNTQPPSDLLFSFIYNITQNITLIQPPFIDRSEFSSLPKHEFESLYMNNSLELYCLHFGSLKYHDGDTKFSV